MNQESLSAFDSYSVDRIILEIHVRWYLFVQFNLEIDCSTVVMSSEYQSDRRLDWPSIPSIWEEPLDSNSNESGL